MKPAGRRRIGRNILNSAVRVESPAVDRAASVGRAIGDRSFRARSFHEVCCDERTRASSQ
jgi:hypothetical protein